MIQTFKRYLAAMKQEILPRGHFHSPTYAAPPALAGAQHPAGSAPYLLSHSLYGSIIISFTGAVTLLTN